MIINSIMKEVISKDYAPNQGQVSIEDRVEGKDSSWARHNESRLELMEFKRGTTILMKNHQPFIRACKKLTILLYQIRHGYLLNLSKVFVTESSTSNIKNLVQTLDKHF